MDNFNGIIDNLISGEWISPISNKPIKLPIQKIEIANSLDGREIDFIKETHKDEKILIISDQCTHDILGSRVYKNLIGKCSVAEFIWSKPKADINGIKEIQEISRDFSSLIAIGSGTITDSVKYATFLDKKKFSVFATTPMNAYTTPTASISFNGFKKSITSHPATGAYFDLSIISKCPKRLTKAGFADVICRTTAQVDWLMSHFILNSHYDETPYLLLKLYEEEMMDQAKQISKGEVQALSLLTKICAIMGISTIFTGTTHCGSMSEHLISHYIDMFAKNDHPGTSHGEQVGIATMTISKIQNEILLKEKPPIFFPTKIPEKELKSKIGSEIFKNINPSINLKVNNEKKAEQLNHYLDKNWTKFVNPLRKVMVNFNKLWSVMGECGALRTPEEAGLNKNFYNDALMYARFIRNRYTILDFADDSNQLEKFIN